MVISNLVAGFSPRSVRSTYANPVLQHQVDRTAGEWLPAISAAIGGRPDLANDAGAIEVRLQFRTGLSSIVFLTVSAPVLFTMRFRYLTP
jgi:hypothetical protein